MDSDIAPDPFYNSEDLEPFQIIVDEAFVEPRDQWREREVELKARLALEVLRLAETGDRDHRTT